MRLIIINAVLLFVLSNTASADLILDIVGAPGSGATTWTFNGSQEAGASGYFDDNTLQFADSWYNVGDLFADGATYSELNEPVGGSATITIGGSTRNIDRLFLHNTGTLGGDDLGLGVDGSANFEFVAGQVVSWSGSFTLTQDISNFHTGTFGSSNLGGASTNNLPLTVRVNAVPEPSSVTLLAFAGVAGAMRRRHS